MSRWVAALAVPAMIVFVLSPLLLHPWALGQHNWDQMNTQRELVVKTILPKADLIFLSDIHYDHLDAAAVSLLTRPGTLVIGPPAVAARIHVDVVLRNDESARLLGIDARAVPMYNLRRGSGAGAPLSRARARQRLPPRLRRDSRLPVRR